MSIKPKVLIFSDWYLPGYKAGGPISSVANLVSHLGSDIQFKIVCSDRDYIDREPYDLPVNKWINRGLEDVMYISLERRRLTDLKKLIREIDPDVVYVNGVFSKVFSIYALRAARALNRKTVVAPRGMLAASALGIKPAKKKVFLALARLLGVYNRVVFHATHENEKEHIENLFPNVNVAVIPNLPASTEAKIEKSDKLKNRIRILSIARIAPEKNTLFALQVLSLISPEYRVTATFIGHAYSEKYFELCRKLAAQMPRHVEITFAGAVKPAELEPYFESSDLFFMPTLGENYGHAIIESLLHGLPVLISDQTPWRDLQQDGLGADLPLKEAENFKREIEKVAAMDTSAYNDSFGNVVANASKRIDLNSTKSRYRELFQ